jgi:thiamine-monophosphate kinase
VTEAALISLIRRLSERQRPRDPRLVLGVGDDCAVWTPRSGFQLLITTDQLIEGVHYRREAMTGRQAGARLVGRGLSDIAAMGGEPRLAFLNLALPRADVWVIGFLRGFAAALHRYDVAWAGGDVSAVRGAAVASITVLGEVPRGQALTRSGARPGDRIYVTGRLAGMPARIVPRLAAGRALRRVASACIDLSDGLSTDLHHLCRESGAGAVIRAAAIPRAGTLAQALHRGEDYELLFTAAAAPRRIAGVPVTEIGVITRGRSVLLDGKPLRPGGWEHFRQRTGI